MVKNFNLNNIIFKERRNESFYFFFYLPYSNIFLKKNWFNNFISFKFSNIKQRDLSYIVFLNLIFLWRSIRHLFGLPVNGQRTWSNANNSKKVNTILINFKINQFKLIYINFKNLNLLKQLIFSEFINLILKKHVYKDWIFLVKKNKITQKFQKIVKFKNFNFKKIFDFIGFEKGFLYKKFLFN